jgi:hypothetical protein
MQRTIGYTDFGHPRSLIEERPARPPIIGKICPGSKVLTKAAPTRRRCACWPSVSVSSPITCRW